LFPCVLPRYQPFVPAIPSIVYVIVGGAADAIGASRSERPSPTVRKADRSII
jgi:hypothetical protein